MNQNGRRDKTRRIVIITLSASITGLTAALAAVFDRIGTGLAVLIGYIILFMSAALLNVLMHASASYTKRILLLVFSICLLMLFLGGIAYILFNRTPGEESRADAEISISSAPQTNRVTGETDNASSNLPDASSAEAAVNVPENETPKKDASEIMAAYVPEETSSGGAESIIQDNLHIDRAETPSIPVFIEPNVTEIMTIIGGADAATDIIITDDPVSVPDTPVFIEATVIDVDATVSIPSDPVFIEPRISDVNEDDALAVPVIIGGIDTETEIQIAEEVSETASSDNGFFSGLSPEEADFWADFYIAGEDELELADGIYYMDLYVNDNYTGYIETIVSDGEVSLNRDEFYSYISENIEDSLLDSIFGSNDPYIPLDILESLGVGTRFDSGTYSIYLTFSTADMPIQILSIRGRNSSSSFRPIAGGMRLDPAVFVLRSNYSLDASLLNLQNFDLHDSMRFTFSSTNNGRLYDLYFNFNYYLYFGADYFNFNMGSYNFYYDFEDAMIRLSFGNVTSDVLYPNGRAVGIRFDKSYVYGAPDASRGSQIESLLVVEKRSEVIIYNEGREIFRRTLDPGRYRLQDFILYTGANEILIRVEPLDGSSPEEITMNVNYSSSLIAPGDFYYGGSLVTGRSIVSENGRRDGALSIPIGNSKYLEYDWRDITASFYLRTGLTENLSISSTIAIQNKPEDVYNWNPRVKLTTELTHANILGTTRYNLNIDEHFDDSRKFGMPGIYARIGHQVSTGWNPISSINLGLTYSNPVELNRDEGHRLSLSASLSGRIDWFNWNTGFTGTLYTDNLSEFIWSWTNTINLNLSRNFWMSGSLMLNGTGADTSVSGRVYATVRFDGGSVSASSNIKDLSVSTTYRVGDHSISGNFRINDFDNLNRYSIGAGYAYNGDFFNFDTSVNSDILFRNTGLQMSLSTSTVFADGMFAIGSYVPSNFLLIRQKGALAGNQLSVGTPGTSSASMLSPIFGTYVYPGLSSTRGAAFSLFSTDDNTFGRSASFDINVPYSDRTGYILTLDAEDTYSVAGYAELPDGTVWINGASPLYTYSDVNGEIQLETTDDYVFSDGDGMFIISDLAAGLYAFDIQMEKGWMLAIFNVESNVESGVVQFLKTDEGSLSDPISDIYIGSIFYVLDSTLTSEAFWKLIYPEMEVAV